MADSLVLTLDVADADVQTEFWCAALGYEHAASVVQYRALVDPSGKGPKMLLQRVDELKTAKNRLHLDLHVGAEQRAATVQRLEKLGATKLYDGAGGGSTWVTMADPEGNEFCVA